MALHTLVGRIGSEPAAAMVDSGTGWMIGPAFHGDDAPEQIEAFKAWLRSGEWLARIAPIFGQAGYALDGRFRVHLLDAQDPRGWTSEGLERLFNHWRSVYVQDDELIPEPDEERGSDD